MVIQLTYERGTITFQIQPRLLGHHHNNFAGNTSLRTCVEVCFSLQCNASAADNTNNLGATYQLLANIDDGDDQLRSGSSLLV